MEKQTEIFPQYRQSLFSNNYLQHHLPKTAFWKNNYENIQGAFMQISQAYQNIKGLNLGPGEEANLEDKFIRPVLKALGYEWDVQPPTQRGPKKKRPDYALFKDKTTHIEARKHKEDLKRFFSHALTILEAKYWGRRLNDTDNKDVLDARDPTAQTVKYLDDVYHASNNRIEWAILTNGKEWRLFYYHATSRLGNYYEVDLETTILKNDLNAFKYFCLFFARDAFIPDTLTNKSWLEQHLAGSEAYATRVSEKLKNLIFDQIFEGLATGFIEYRRNELGIKNETEETLKEIFNGCLTLLYRLLFLLYAESRNLLPIEDQNRYYKKSLKKLKEDIVKDLSTTGLEGMSHQAYDYWSRLESHCRIIDKGDQALNVPIYNGGLFQTPPRSFLATHKLADPYLAEAIELLTVDQEGDHAPGSTAFIDYSSLGVRHLGDIYEGLLEFHVRIAEKEMVEVREKGGPIWKTKEDIGKAHSSHANQVKRPGEVYIENVKHERRATGSYYTPHYIVEYIVKNTVGPILDERLKKAEGILSVLEDLYKKQRKQLGKKKDWKHWEQPGKPKGKHIEEITKKEQELFNTFFDIKVLDPAMGSGHFLVHTVDFIADKLITSLAKYPDNPVIAQIESMKQQILENVAKQDVKIDESRLTEVNLIKRMVMKKCIYGVDINEMAVELAKLSLWLDSFTLGAPLSFLDHHLKCGNSLIGITASEVKDKIQFEKTQATLFGSQFAGLLSATELMRQVGELTDATFEDIQRSVTLYERADQTLKPFKRILDLWLSEHFGNKGAQKFLTHGGDVQSLLKDINELEEKDQRLVFEAERLKREKRFFHWQLEFPESFYDATHEKENPGFDVVIGNPPYRTLALGKGQETLDKNDAMYFRAEFPSSSEYKTNTFAMFTEQGIRLNSVGGRFSFILPSTICTNHYFRKFRNKLLVETKLDSLVEIDERIFPDVEIGGNTILVILKEKPAVNPSNFLKIYQISQSFDFVETSTIVQRDFLTTPDNKFLVQTKAFSIITKCVSHAKYLSEIAVFYNGIKTGNNEQFLSLSPSRLHRKVLRGRDIDKYSLDWGGVYVLFDPAQLWSNTDETKYESSPKLIVRQTGDSLVAALDIDKYYTMDSTHLVIPYNPGVAKYILALYNSKLLNWYYHHIVPEVGRAFAEMKIVDLKKLPIYSIDFTTLPNLRQKKVAQATVLYQSGISSFDQILKWTQTELSADHNDTIHDLLDFLSAEMIDMNSQKQKLLKKFLHWLEKEIVKRSIDELRNKTKIQEFHKHPVNTLLAILKSNKCIPNPAPSKILDLIEKEFEDVMLKLSPLKEQIKATDQLIDQIVYKLYGLTQQEIQIVEGSVNSNS